LIDKTIDPDAPAVNLVDPSQSTVPDEPPEEYGPYGDEPAKIPGTIEVEEYNKGGADKGYYDLSKGNEGDKFRKNDVDIYQPNMGLVVGHCQKGEWLKYTVKVEADGEYEISALVAGENSTGSFKLYMDDEAIGTEIANDGQGFTTFSEVSGGKATLKAGEHELKLEITNDWIDIDNVTFKKVENNTAIAGKLNLMTEAESSFNLFDMHGKRVTSFKAAGMDAAVSMVKAGSVADLKQGIYYVRTKGHQGAVKQKVIVYEK